MVLRSGSGAHDGERGKAMEIVRKIGAVVLVVAAIAVWFGLKPSDSALNMDSIQIAAIMADDQANQERAEGAPQQTVVNGWTARNLLEVIAQQGTTPAADQDQRPAALLVLTVIGVALLAFTTTGSGSKRQDSLEDLHGTSPSPEFNPGGPVNPES